MKGISLIILCFFVVVGANGQSLRKLKVFKSSEFSKEASLTVSDLKYDPLGISFVLSNALMQNGFKVISSKSAQERVTLSNSGSNAGGEFNQNMELSKSQTFKSVYVINYSYDWRSDIFCGGSVITRINGQIVDLINDDQVVATFSFNQTDIEGKCAERVMFELVKLLAN
jgi:hypothetical protein